MYDNKCSKIREHINAVAAQRDACDKRIAELSQDLERAKLEMASDDERQKLLEMVSSVSSSICKSMISALDDIDKTFDHCGSNLLVRQKIGEGTVAFINDFIIPRFPQLSGIRAHLIRADSTIFDLTNNVDLTNDMNRFRTRMVKNHSENLGIPVFHVVFVNEPSNERTTESVAVEQTKKSLINDNDAEKIKKAIDSSPLYAVGSKFTLKVPNDKGRIDKKIYKKVINQIIYYINKHYGTWVTHTLSGEADVDKIAAAMNKIIAFINYKFTKNIPPADPKKACNFCNKLSIIIDFLRAYFKKSIAVAKMEM